MSWKDRIKGRRAANIIRTIARKAGVTFDQAAATFEVLLSDNDRTEYHDNFDQFIRSIMPEPASPDELVKEMVSERPQKPEIIKIDISQKNADAKVQELIKKRMAREAQAEQKIAELVRRSNTG